MNAAATGLHNGTSWANAFIDLDTPLSNYATDTVWVANGTYKPLRYSTYFGIADTVRVFGGFNGTETQLSQRNWTTFQTILDGTNCDIFYGSSAVTVVRFGTKSRSYPIPIVVPFRCRLDGFKVTGANGPSQSLTDVAPILVSPSQSTVSYSQKIGTVDIANCLITGNISRLGGGVGIFYGGNGEVRITNCRFENNTAVIAGGAIFSGSTDGTGKIR